MHHPTSPSCLRTTGLFLGLTLLLCRTPAALAQEPVADAPPAPETAAEAAQPQTAVTPPSRSQVQELSLERLLPATQQRRLDIGEQPFLGLFLPAARPEPWGGIILIAGQEEHADWPTLIGPARRQLSAAGWHTLAISLPERTALGHEVDEAARRAHQEAYREQTLARIKAARQVLIAESGDQPDLPVILLGRAQGAFWALSAAVAAEAGSPVADALILQGLQQTTEGEVSTSALLEQWSGPTYDILISPSAHADARRLQAKRLGHAGYRQLRWPRGDNSELQQEMLIKRLDGWLRRLLSEIPGGA